MRRKLSGAILLAAICVASAGTATTAAAAPPPITNIAPTNGARLPLPTYVFETLRFACPSYGETQGSFVPITTTHDYHEYSFRLADSPEEEAPGKLELFDTVSEGPALELSPGECTASPPSALPLRSGTYYWQVIRGGALTGEYGPIWSFSTGAPTVSTECASEPKGLTKGTICPAGSRIAARFTSPFATSYILCVRAPGKAQRCFASKKVKAGDTSQRILPNGGAGRYTITWKAGRKTYTKHVRIRS